MTHGNLASVFISGITLILLLPGAAAADNPMIAAVVNSASLTMGPVAPRELVTLFGTSLGGNPPCATSGTPLPTSCNGTSVLFNGKPAPILNASPTQITFQVPVDVGGTNATVQVTYQSNGQLLQSAPVNLIVAPTVPGVFTLQSNTNFGAFVQTPSQTIVTTSSPAHPGDTVEAFGTGFGATDPPGTSGSASPTSAKLLASVSATVGGQPATVVFAGTFSVGQDVVIITVPQGVPYGNVPFVVSVGGVASPPVLLPVAIGSPVITSVSNSASGRVGVQSGSWVSIYGTNLATTTRPWQSSDFNGNNLPTTLDGVSVTINGKSAAVYFVSPGQLNVQAPDDTVTGTVQVQVKNSAGSATGTATLQQYAPGFFTFQNKYVAAVHTDGVYVAPTGFFGNTVTSRSARPGETLLLYGTGFGPTAPAVPSLLIVAAPEPLTDPSQLKISIGSVAATVQYAGLTAVGEYQFNVVVPDVPDGDQTITATISGASTQTGLLIPVKRPQ